MISTTMFSVGMLLGAMAFYAGQLVMDIYLRFRAAKDEEAEERRRQTQLRLDDFAQEFAEHKSKHASEARWLSDRISKLEGAKRVRKT